MRSRLDDPLFWHNRAEDARAMAEELADPASYRIMLSIADGYEEIARVVEQRRSRAFSGARRGTFA